MALLFRIIDAYSLVVLASVIVSWIPDLRHKPIARWLDQATEPALRPIRQVVPAMGGFDVSPMVLLVALSVLKRVLAWIFY